MQNQSKNDLEIKDKLLQLHSHKDEYGQWHNNIPAYRKQIVTKIRDWVTTGGRQIAKEAQDQGWYSMTGKIGYGNYTIPDKPCESLVGYLNIVLLRQYFLFYGIEGSFNGGSELPEVQKWLKSHAFRDEVLRSSYPMIRYKLEHLNLIRDSVLK